MNLNIILGDCSLIVDVDHLFFKTVMVADLVDVGKFKGETWPQGASIPAKSLKNLNLLLLHEYKESQWIHL